MSENISGGLLGGVVGLVTSAIVSDKKAHFANVPQASNTANTTLTKAMGSISNTTIIVICVILIIVIIMLCIAVYKLTDSIWQTILCFLFGALYLIVATMYYGFSGYKYQIANNKILNNRIM